MESRETKDSPGVDNNGIQIQSSKHENDKFRMWAATSFAIMLLIVGIPLWWKTTEVYRAPLPYNKINELNPSGLQILVNISIYTEYPSRTNTLLRDLQTFLSSMGLYKVNLKLKKIDIEPISIDTIEKSNEVHPKTPGSLLLVQVPEIPNGGSAFISSHRIVYFTPNTKSSVLGDLIRNYFLDEKSLTNKIMTIVNPEKFKKEKKEIPKRLRASLSYDIIFTVINSDPERVNLTWDVEHAIKAYVSPLLEQINLVSNHTAKSQWLYLVDLGEDPHKSGGDDFVLSYSQLPHIITPLEKKLGSGISKNPCVHMILYTTSCQTSPLYFLTPSGEKVTGMTSPEWGAIQLLNPEPKHCSTNRTALTPLPQEVMAMFVSQLHELLGFTNPDGKAGVSVEQKRSSRLHEWELDSLYRLRTVEQITSASLTLQSLAKLLGEISNIVINEDVAGSVLLAVNSIEKAVKYLRNARLEEALILSQLAFKEAETAFSNPSLLALLYFPDDQKYAVYIPLFLPVMIPVLMSLKNIYRWLFNLKPAPHEKKE